jgi:hypothetical protein
MIEDQIDGEREGGLERTQPARHPYRGGRSHCWRESPRVGCRPVADAEAVRLRSRCCCCSSLAS